MLSTNYDCSCINRENLPLPIQIKLSKRQEFFFFLFFCIFGIYIEFPMFRMRLLKCMKGLVCENPLAVKVLTSPKNS